MAQVSLRKVSKYFAGNVKAVDSVSLGVENKEFLSWSALQVAGNQLP